MTEVPLWLPFEPQGRVQVPEGVRVGVWDGEGEAPAELSGARFWVLPSVAPQVLDALGRVPDLEVVQTMSAGVDSVRPVLPEGVTLCNARGVHDAATAEQAVALALAAQREIPRFVRAQDRHAWEQTSAIGLADRTVLILGYGSIGAAVERRLVGFECEILRVARSARTTDAGPVASLEDLPDLLPRAEVLIIVVPLTDQTRGLVDAAALAALPDGALVVNIARGPVVDAEALYAETSSGRLRAALDVTDPEPLPEDSPLWDVPGVLIAPHVGGDTSAFRPRIDALLSDQIARWARDTSLRNVVTGDY